MNDTEALIREALLHQARRTPPPGPVLAALHRPRRGRKPLLLALATAATAAAVAVAVTAIPRPSAEQAPPAQPVATTAATTTGTPGMVMHEYAPTWLPDGFAERRRSWTDHGTQRLWDDGTDDPKATPTIEFRVVTSGIDEMNGFLDAAPGADRTTVNGAPGFFGERMLNWRVAPDRFLAVEAHNVPDPRDLLRRVAESVRPDDTPIPVPVSLDGSTDVTFDGQGPTDWRIATNQPHEGVRYTVVLQTSDPGGAPFEEVTALGRPARYRAGPGATLTVVLAPDRYLTVGGLKADRATARQLTRVAERVRFDQDPDMSWLGR